MLSLFFKNLVQKRMLSSAPGSQETSMNTARAEDLDFSGLPADSRPAEQRARDVLDAMSFEEKLAFIGGYKSLGVRALSRHGLPSVWMTDATSGPRCYGATTAFPSAVAMAATWDPELVARCATHIAEATRAKGVSILLGPGVNIARVPSCGRNFEYMGEDPFLTGKLAAAYVQAAAARGVICTVKHMAANNSEYDRHKTSSDMDPRTLREIYLPAFELAVKEGKTRGIMSAYNPLNGTWASENAYLLTTILREEWGFDGIVVSDWNSLYSTAGPLKSGLDIEMPKARWLSAPRIRKAIADGKASPDDVDRMVFNLLKTFFEAGIYDRPVIDPEAREFHPDHDLAALEAARAGAVLLKNDNNVLPLPEGDGITIAVCGPNAVNSATLGGGSCHVASTTGTIDLADGLRNVAMKGTRIVYLPGRRGRFSRIEQTQIKNADAVVMAFGFNHVLESEVYDRPWKLPADQRRMIQKASALNPRSVVILSSGGGVETESWINRVQGLVHGLYLGQTVGTATAELLFGRFNPSGKLPFSMAKRWNDIAATRSYPRRFWTTSPGRIFLGQGNPRYRRIKHWTYSEGLMVGYRHFDSSDIEPAFPFGFGLSYSNFHIEELRLSSQSIGPDDTVELSVKVKNIGERAGAEVVQIYVEDPESRLPRPKKELKGFAKVHLDAGEETEVKISLPPRSFQYWDPDAGKGGRWVAEPGEFRILAGRSSRHIDQVQTLTMN